MSLFTAFNRLFAKPGKAELSRPLAAPSLTGIRQPWHNTISRGVTPAQLSAWLSAADLGDAEAYLTLAEEMEERDPHYASVLSTRKRAVLGLPRLVEAASDDAADVKLADAARDFLLTPDLSGLLSGLLDALGKGYSAVELIWRTDSTPWVPTYTWRDPRFFRYDRETGSVLRLLDASNAYDGIELPPYRFIVHTPRLKMGLPIRGGLARLCAAGHVCALYALEDWLAFAEVFGMPLRLGRYNSSASEDDKAKLKAAVSGLGADAAAVLHESMQIEFQAAAPGAGGADLYERLLDNLHKLVSKAVLGRSDAADATAGRLGNEQSSAEVRRDILESDAEELSQTLNMHLVRPFIDLNFGPQERYPTLKLYVPDQEDLAALVDMLAKLVPLGLKVEQSVIRDKFGLPDPDPKGELLGAPAQPVSNPPLLPTTNRALNRQALFPAPDAIDTLAAEALADWEPLMQPVINPIQTLAEAADSFVAFQAGLLGLLSQMDSADLVQSLALAAFKARGMGDGEKATALQQQAAPDTPFTAVDRTPEPAAPAPQPISIQFSPQIHVANQLPDQPPPQVSFSSPEVVINNVVQLPDQPAPTVTVNAIAAPPIIQVQPAEVAVQLNLPPRKTETAVVRDSAGNIVTATQIETDLTPQGEPNS